MGFGRIDELAREIAARKRASDPSARRSTPARWAMLGLLAAVGIGGAIYFVAGSSSGAERPELPPKGYPPHVTKAPPGGEPAAVPALPEAPDAPDGPAPSLELAAAGASAARAAQIAVVLDDVDATLHGLRLTWPGQPGSFPWRAPTWLSAERFERELVALDDQLAGASDPLSLRTREWIVVARADGARLLGLHAAWSAPGAVPGASSGTSPDAIAAELRPLFDRLVAASQAVHAAIAANAKAPPSGSLAALAGACRVAPLLARLPVRGAAAGPPVVEQGGAAPASAPMPEPPEAELRALATACLDEARAFLAANPGAELDVHDLYHLRLASQIALDLLSESERRRKPPAPVFVSAAANLAQESSLLATARRRHDPTLRPAERAPVPAEAPPR